VTDPESARPIPGAFVSLLGQEGSLLRSALTNESGRFLFPVPESGTYQVRAEMIGRETQVSSPVSLQGGESVAVELSLPVHAIALAGIRVEADEQCRIRPDEATQIARVWEEARKALAVQAWTEAEALYRLTIATYERNLDPSGRRVVGEARRVTSVFTRTPFASLPPEDLMSEGFIRPLESGGHQYLGPDAPVLLSDLFLDSHCFRLRRSDDLPNSIGLDFEPVRASERADIQGTLWLDEETAHLQFLEYGYTWAPYREARGIAEGRVEFEAMPNGAWVIDRWWIRAPTLAQHFDLVRAGDSGIRVSGMIETGGEVTGIRTRDDRRVSEVERGAVTGLVWDSTRYAPLEGATVYLSGTQYAGVTDGVGRFRMEGLPEGVFTAAFTHPRLDTLGVFPPGKEVSVTPGEISELNLGIPASETILLASCRVQEREEGAAVLSGFVRNSATGEPIPGARVRLEWQEVTRTDPVVQATDRFMEVWTNAEGRYTACGVPLDEAIFVTASLMERASEAVEVGFTEEELRVQDLEIGFPPGVFSTRTELQGWIEEYGVQGVQGILTDPESGNPVRSAEVGLEDASGRISVTGVSNQRGFFRLQTPVPGRYLFTAEALGYAPVEEEVVDVPQGHLAVLEVRMAPEALELEPLVVQAEARAFHLEMEGFYEREVHSAHGGVFLEPNDLEKRRPLKLTDVFFSFPGTRVVEAALGAGPRAVYFPRSGERPAYGGIQICWPMIYLDRQLISTGGLSGATPTALDEYVHGADVAAVEVYRSAAEVPAEFNGPNAGCGVIVVWSKKAAG
jgi:hypothetical protein